jgi:hypothetical protein
LFTDEDRLKVSQSLTKRHRLSFSEVLQIKELLQNGISVVDCANQIGCKISQVKNIATGKSFKDESVAKILDTTLDYDKYLLNIKNRCNIIADEKTKEVHWIWIGPPHKSGYGMFNIRNEMHYTHRWAYYLANKIDYLDPKIEVRHKCKEKLCCNPDHLEIGTSADNAKDKKEMGRCYLAKITSVLLYPRKLPKKLKQVKEMGLEWKEL